MSRLGLQISGVCVQWLVFVALFDFVSPMLCIANAYSQSSPNTLHIATLCFQKAPWINWLRLMPTDCSYFNWLLFSNKIRDFYENRR